MKKKNVDRVKKLLPKLQLSHLNPDDRKDIEIICAKFSDIFFLEGDKLGTANVVDQSITVKPNTKPVYTKPYRLPESLKPEINKQIQRMLDDDIIEASNSEWNSPILLVPKKSDSNEKKWRLVVDYRKVNDSIQDDKFPLPNITEILDSLSGSVYFTHLDLHQGFYQASLKPESRNITSFATNTGHYQMKRLPMGLKISPSAFSRMMSIAMSGLTYEQLFIYCDDVICFGRNKEIHNKNLMTVFERFRKMNLKLNASKCDFMKTQLLYLGHVVSAKGVLPDPEKIRVLQNYPIPKTADEVRRFVAFCNYYRKFIPSFSEITIPLNKLCRKNASFIWTEECQRSFENLQNKLTSSPILQYPDFSKENTFVLQTDASNVALGSILCNEDLKPIAYASRPLNKAELNYPTIQKELLAIIWSVKYFRPYLYGRKFTILTDHKPLIYLFGMKDPSTRLLKFRLQLEEYDYNVVYIKGRDNVADALSRVTISSEDLKLMHEKINIMVTTRAQAKKLKDQEISEEIARCSSIPAESRSGQPRVAEILRKPSDYVELNFIEGNKLRNKNITYQKECFAYEESSNTLFINLNYMSYFTRVEFTNILGSVCNKLSIKELCMIKTNENKEFMKNLVEEINNREKWTGPRLNILRGIKRVLDKDEKTCILHDFHMLPSSGHAGVRRMVNNIKGKYFWSGMEQDVRNYVSKCSKCQLSKYSRNTIEPMEVTTTASKGFEKIYMDIIGPLDKDIEGNIYILSLQCELTKYVELYPLQRKDTVSVARSFVNNFVLRYGLPKIVATDRGSEFMSETMTQVCKLLQIEKVNSTAYHHQSIGALENTHKHLAAFLRTQCDGHTETWSQWIPFWCFSYNTTVHTETKYTPYELVFGNVCRLPSNLTNDLVEPLYNADDYALELKYRLQLASKEVRKNLIVN